TMLDVLRMVRPVMAQIEKHDRDLGNQLRRASSSVPRRRRRERWRLRLRMRRRGRRRGERRERQGLRLPGTNRQSERASKTNREIRPPRGHLPNRGQRKPSERGRYPMTTKGKNAKAVQVTNIITGTKKHLPNGSQPLTIGGVTVTVDQATTKMQTFVDNRDSVETAQATAASKVAAEQAQMPSLLAFIAAFVTFIRLTFGNSADVLGDFDIPPLKARVPMTAEAKAIAAAKRVA